MLKHVTFLGATALTMSLSGTAFAQDDVTVDTVIATVGETEITLGEVLIARTELPEQYAQFPEEVLFEGLIDQLIQQQLLADTVEDAPATVLYALKNEERTLLAGAAITVVAEAAITPDIIQAAYDERFANAEELPEFHAAHLLVETEEEAIAAKNRIDEGEEFADVARAVSTGPTGPNGGDLGWFGPGAMVPEFETAITELEVGGVSDPFETQFGWHLATLLEERVQPRPTLEEMTPQLTGELQEAAITAHLEQLAADSNVIKPEEGQFDATIISRFDLLD
ncbi:peptidylprolyl isomerase [Loktanella sp. D2R18]|uniref:peptidylprolyl isomerase n=1 Tax=Rhodobacterales TaxID=204455 RepID=UPI000DE97E24|nr:MULTISPECIES: peptidylprolyl isomerase [Rhodobacterales]MDO6590408.1 peptidylprolyl isomerase [Yoonia sp. 1_MG-2023]RBW41134.1 peptidylprolyl isomerase [Loktanella sp. D2R18]